MTLKYWFIENSQSQRHPLYNLLKWQASDPNTPLTWFNTYTAHPGQRAFAFFLTLVFCWGNSRSLAVTETNLPRGRLHSTASQWALTLPGCGPGVELHTGMSEITCSPPRNQTWVKPEENKLTTILEGTRTCRSHSAVRSIHGLQHHLAWALLWRLNGEPLRKHYQSIAPVFSIHTCMILPPAHSALN